VSLPRSFQTDGFIIPKAKYKRLLVGTEGGANTGKTEFGLSAPGPGIWLALDRGTGLLNNPNPPEARNESDFALVPVTVPLQTMVDQSDAATYWNAFRILYNKSLANQDARTLLVDGDSDGFELQTLAEFGKVIQIPPILRTKLNAARRAYTAKAFDSGKIVIMTNKLKRKYENVLNADGSPKVDAEGKNIREWDGASYERQGFNDHEFLFELQLKHLYRPESVNPVSRKKVPQSWGVRILMAKANREVEGAELWGSDCNFLGVVSLVYPHIDPSEWGFK
jgi:hypothetical protein